jgi:steroid delta-isomerase-like uncharacterized protein
MMFDHLSFGVSNLALSKAFFLQALAPLKAAVVMEGPYGVGIGQDMKPSLWLHETQERLAPVHIAFAAESRADVDAFHQAALAAGGKDNGAPGLRPHYHPNYYGAFVIGPDGHNIEAVCHQAQPSMPEVTTDVLHAFAEAWNRHDIDALMSFMADDCAFESSAGPDVCGTRYAGREAVRAGFAQVWAVFPDAHWGHARHVVQGDRGMSEWTFTGTRADGSRVEVQGCDLFTFRDGKIALKNSYRKNRTPAGAAPNLPS